MSNGAQRAREALSPRQVKFLTSTTGECDLEDAVIAFQKSACLTVDGWPGLGTQMAMYKAGGPFPIPASRAEVEKLFGSPKWKRVKEGGRAIRWTSKDSPGKRVRRVQLHNGDSVVLLDDICDEFAEIFKEACEASGYTPKSVVGYVPRTIGLSEDPSYHAYALAVDFDPQDNPWGGVRADGSPSLLRQNMAFVDVFESSGWSWGGRWRKGEGDDMHFERKG